MSLARGAFYLERLKASNVKAVKTNSLNSHLHNRVGRIFLVFLALFHIYPVKCQAEIFTNVSPEQKSTIKKWAIERVPLPANGKIHIHVPHSGKESMTGFQKKKKRSSDQAFPIA